MWPAIRNPQRSGLRGALKIGKPGFPSTKAEILAELQLGVTDIRAEDDDTGYWQSVGSIPVGFVDLFLRKTATDQEYGERNSIQDVDPRFVLAKSWKINRLQEAQKRIQESICDDPIRVGGLRLPGLPVYYHVADGMHRTVAARLAGKRQIQALTYQHQECSLDNVRVIGNSLLRPSTRGCHEVHFGVSDKMVDFLEIMGVPVERGFRRKLRRSRLGQLVLGEVEPFTVPDLKAIYYRPDRSSGTKPKIATYQKVK